MRPACMRGRHNYGEGNGERHRRMVAVKHAPKHWGMERQREPHDEDLEYEQRRGAKQRVADKAGLQIFFRNHIAVRGRSAWLPASTAAIYKACVQSRSSLTHHVHILEMNGESFRLKHSRKHQKDQT